MTEETDDLSTFFCPNENCPDHGNIRLKEHYGKNNTALLRCTTYNTKTTPATKKVAA